MKPGLASASDAQLLAAAGALATTIFHPVGTCRMGREDDIEAVVGPDLRVRGVDGLRIVDASVMPTLTSGNTAAPTMAIAERASHLILQQAQRHVPASASVPAHGGRRAFSSSAAAGAGASEMARAVAAINPALSARLGYRFHDPARLHAAVGPARVPADGGLTDSAARAVKLGHAVVSLVACDLRLQACPQETATGLHHWRLQSICTSTLKVKSSRT